MIPKATTIKSKAVRQSAKGENCTLNIVGVCNHNPETVVLAHLPDESHGMAMKSSDLVACYACSSCHDQIDRRTKQVISVEEREWYMRRAQSRTLHKLIEKNIVEVKL